MRLRIKINAAQHTVEIDGTKFEVPNDPWQRAGLRELVVNYWCKINGYRLLYPETPSARTVQG